MPARAGERNADFRVGAEAYDIDAMHVGFMTKCVDSAARAIIYRCALECKDPVVSLRRHRAEEAVIGENCGGASRGPSSGAN